MADLVKRFVCTLSAIAGILPLSASANTIVVKSTGPSASSLPPGLRLEDGKKLALKMGDSVVILGHDGTYVMRGPGQYRVAFRSRASDMANAATRFLTPGRYRITRLARTGAKRDSLQKSNRKRPAPLWAVDIENPGNQCVRPQDRVMLWRTDSSLDPIVEIARASSSERAVVEFSAGVHDAEWPIESLKPASGDMFIVHRQPNDRQVRITFKTIAAQAIDPIDTAEQLITHGCEAQLDRLINALSEQTGP